MVCFPVSSLLFVGFVYLTSADYTATNNDDGYGEAQVQPLQVQQVPYYGKPDYNQPMYANVKGGRHHGPFFDVMINNYKHRRHSGRSRWSSSDSDEHRRGHHHGNHHGYYPAAPAWPYFGYDQQLSNPFFSPYHSKGRRGRHHKRHHKKHYSSSSSSGDRD